MVLPNCGQGGEAGGHSVGALGICEAACAVHICQASTQTVPQAIREAFCPHLAVRHQGDGLPLALAGRELEEACGLGLHAVEQGRPRADAQPLLHLQR